MSAVIKFEQEQKPVASLPQRRKLIYIALIIGLNLGAFIVIYKTFFSGPKQAPPAPPPVLGVQPGAAPAPTPNGSPAVLLNSTDSFQRFIDQLIQDLSVLNDPRYQLLRSLGVKIPVVKSGRENPFAPY